MKSLNDFQHINEAKLPIPDFKTGWEIIDFLDEIPEFKKFRNDVAQYDDTYFLIPRKEWDRHVGWSIKEVQDMNDKLDNYEGSIDHQGKFVHVMGGA